MSICSFYFKLILSYLPVHLTYFLPSSPLTLHADAEELSVNGWVCLGLPGMAARHMLQTASISSQWWVGKMLYMSVGAFGAWAKVRCTGRYDNISFKMKTTFSSKLKIKGFFSHIFRCAE